MKLIHYSNVAVNGNKYRKIIYNNGLMFRRYDLLEMIFIT